MRPIYYFFTRREHLPSEIEPSFWQLVDGSDRNREFVESHILSDIMGLLSGDCYALQGRSLNSMRSLWQIN